MIKNLKYIASLDRSGMKKALIWEILHSCLVVAPSGIVLAIVRELFTENPDPSKLWALTGSIAALLLLQFWVATKAMLRSNQWVYGLSTQLRMLLGNRIQKFSLGFFKKRDPGEIASVVLQDVANFEGIFGHSIGNMAAAIFGTVFLSGFLLMYDWRLALCLLVAIPCVIPFLYIANRLISRLGKKQIAARNRVVAKFLEYLHGIRHLKAYGLTGQQHEVLDASFDELRKRSIRMEALPGPFMLVAGIVFEIGFILMTTLGLYYLNGNQLSIPVFLTFLWLGYHLYGPLKVLMVDYVVLRYMNESLHRILEVMEEPTMEVSADEWPLQFDLHFEQVNFAYQEKLVLRAVSFSVPQHSMVALVGPSGSGKTTIASLIARFWDVSEGRIRIGTVDIRHIDQNRFYQLISEVFQEVYLFNDSIYNNIKLGNPEATHEEVIDAADKAQVLGFAWELPEGMDTQVGEGGSKLSGGQKQRISIARALLKNAPIILLDEATASLDPENEVYIQQAIQELIKSKTVLVIAHKLATIQHADQILVLNKGSIVERGTHELLLQQKGVYHHLWTLQQEAEGWTV